MSTFLSKAEVAELTGRKQRQKQVEQLISMHITFTLDAFGWPKVLRKTIETELGAARAVKLSVAGLRLVMTSCTRGKQSWEENVLQKMQTCPRA